MVPCTFCNTQNYAPNAYRARLATHKTIPRHRQKYVPCTTCSTQNHPSNTYHVRFATLKNDFSCMYSVQLATRKTIPRRRKYVPCTTCSTRYYASNTYHVRFATHKNDFSNTYRVRLATRKIIPLQGRNTYTMYKYKNTKLHHYKAEIRTVHDLRHTKLFK